MHLLMLYGDAIIPHTDRPLSAGQVGLMNGWGVFSTLRAHRGILFEFHRHWLRMVKDAEAMKVTMPCTEQELELRLHRLLDANQCDDATIRVVVVRNHGGMWDGQSTSAKSDLIAFASPIKEWPDGVVLGIQPNARFAACEFVGSKILSWSMNLTWLERATERGLNEVVLLNEHGRVAECTSANIFAKFGDKLLTPPLTEGCLPGVTRQLLLDTLHVEGCAVEESPLTIDDLLRSDVCMITSSTRDVISVQSIDGKELNQDPDFVKRWREAFAVHLSAYVKSHPRPLMGVR